MTDRFLRMKEVLQMTGLPKSTMYDLRAEGLFPDPVRIGLRAVAWRESVVIAWMDERINKKTGGR